jgi:protein phosphatase
MAAADAEELAAQTAAALSAAPYWISVPGHILVHGAFHPEMLSCPSQGQGADVPRKLKALSLYGETDGSLNDEGYPIRTYAWVERVPQGLTVIVGHDTRQMHEPLVVDNGQGGRAVFLDTGAAKGGRLSTWMIPPLA